MKKFLAVLLSLIVTVALGFTIFYLVRDNEEIYLSTSTLYVSKDDTFNIDINFKNKKSYTTYNVSVVKETVVKLNEDHSFSAVGGGYTKVLFRTSNVNYRNLDCVVYVGDGMSASTPFYITSAEQLLQIGKADSEGNVKYPLDAYYSLRNNIVLSDVAASNLGYWSPIGYDDTKTGEEAITEFTGHFDGRGYSIINMNLDKAAYNSEVDTGLEDFTKQNYDYAGLFAKLGEGAVVKNVKFENAAITGSYTSAGLVAGEAVGATIERIEVKDVTFDVKGTQYAGAIVGKMESKNNGKLYTTSSIDRASANIKVLSAATTFGGLVGENKGGYVVYSYATGDVELYGASLFGGIVGNNIVAKNNVDAVTVSSGAHVKDTYTSIALTYTIPQDGANNSSSLTVGMVVGKNTTIVEDKVLGGGSTTLKNYSNKIMGNYYNSDLSKIVIADVTTSYTGIGKALKDDNSELNDEKADADYKVKGVTTSNLLDTQTFVSHVDNDEVIAWKFGTVWIEVYNSMPILDYSEQAVSPDIVTIADGITVNDADDFLTKLKDYDQNKPIVIDADIDLTGKVWEAIGTKDAPFLGKVYANYKLDPAGNKVYYKLQNVTTVNHPSDNNFVTYASLFGYLGKDAGLYNITLENAEFTNGEYAAGFAVYNDGGIIEECQLINSAIKGSKYAAGIAVFNNNVIRSQVALADGTGVQVVDSKIEVASADENVLSGEVMASGIACYNYGTISGAVVKGNSENSYVKVVSDGNAASATIAGVAGVNMGTITNTYISFASSSDGVRAEGNFYAMVGGVAGINRGTITKSYVSSNISASTSNDRVVVAGLVAEIMEEGKVSQSGFYGNNKTISGYTAAGIAGVLSHSAKRKIGLNGWDAFWGNAKLTTSKEEMGNGITESYVSGTTTVSGVNVAGLAVTLTNGAIIDSYVGTGVTLKGINSDSEVASFALTVSINYNNSENGYFETGIIAYCYSDAQIDNPGSSYGISKSNILETPSGSYDKKSCGFGISLIVAKSKTSGAKFYDEGWPIYNWFKDGQGNCKASDGDMHTTNGSSNKFTGFGFSSDLWNFGDLAQVTGVTRSGVGPTLSNAVINSELLLVD